MMLGSKPARWTRYRYEPDTLLEDVPTRWRSWRGLCDLIPELDRMHVVRHFNQKPPPRPMSDAAFVALAACFADERKREVLRALIFDLLKDDLKAIMKLR